MIEVGSEIMLLFSSIVLQQFIAYNSEDDKMKAVEYIFLSQIGSIVFANVSYMIFMVCQNWL